MKAYKKFIAFMVFIFIISAVSILGLQGVEEHWSYSFVRQLMAKQVLSNPPVNKEELDLYVIKDEFFTLLRDNKLINGQVESSIKKKLYGFNANSSFITREQACIILGDLLVDGYAVDFSFLDLKDISQEAQRAMQKLNYFYIIDGYPNGNFQPKTNITKAELLKLLTVMSKVPSEYFVKEPSSAQVDEQISVASTFIEVNAPDDHSWLSDSGAMPQTDIAPISSYMSVYPPDFSDNSSISNISAASTADTREHSALIMPQSNANSVQALLSLDISAEMGSSFRGIDVSISAQNGQILTIYYLAQQTGDTSPDQAQIMAYIEGEKSTGLTDGTVVRGKLQANFDGNPHILTLNGGEGVKKLTSETGFIDGYNYDLYMIGINSDGYKTAIAKCSRIMAMPFDAADSVNKTYTIRELSKTRLKEQYPDLLASSKYSEINHTARQLENIQRLADLYIETSGRHGDITFLTGQNTYVLDSDINMSEYMAFDNEKGWRPIGMSSMDKELYFGGAFDGKSNKISNLYIDKDADLYGDKITSQGLFGMIKGAAIMNLELDHANIIIRNTASTEAYVGTLAGHAVNSIIDNVTVNSLKLTAYPVSEGVTGSASGGLIGFADNTDIDDVTINNAVITTKHQTRSDLSFTYYTGGVAGRFRDMGKANLLSNIFMSGEIKASGKGVGGIAGIIECVADNHTVYAHNIDSCVSISGDSESVGGIAGIVENASDGSVITFENCYAAGMVTGKSNIGGIFGQVKSSKTGMILKSSKSEMDVKSDNAEAVIGGVVAYAEGGSYESVDSLGSTLISQLMRIGGFAGYITGDTSFIKCMSNKSIDANRIAGGFAGEVSGNASFIKCSSQGAVITASGEDAGGFIGLQSGGNISFANCFSTNIVRGGENAGGLAGRIGANGSESEFVNCLSTGDINGTVNTGGFIGKLDNESVIIDSYSLGKVDAGSNPGRFIGNMESHFE